ncbi:MAG TPA: Hpt domain-containing protein, partial [Rhodocyclaceae bacterium]|nr:Hpt domain-containing protein [Rhodocyclaceae bacterium]
MARTAIPDLGPLNWVRGEIDQALARAAESLSGAAGAEDAVSQLRFAQTHVHQACGALSIVGLDGLSRIATSLDQLLGDLAADERRPDDGILDIANRTLAAIANYLEELVGGTPDQPLRLFKLYGELAAAGGGAAPSPAELFYPDLARRPPRRTAAGAPPTGEAWQQRLRALRAQFQRGLLQWLRQPADAAGPATMREAADGLEALQAHPEPAALWWAAQAFFDTLAHGDLPADPQLRQVCAMLDKELKQLCENGHTVPERLMRELLYWIARAPARTERQRAVHDNWQLASLLPEPGAAVSELPLAPLLDALGGELAAAKEQWDAFCAGQAVALPRFEAHLSALRDRSAALARPALERLLDGLAGFVRWLRKDPLQLEPPLAIEVATALLLADVALERRAPEGHFAEQVAHTLARLDSLQRGETVPPPAPSPAVEAARRAHENTARMQVAREMLANLAQIEQALDDFFRNQAKRAPLAGLAAPLKQIEGALALVGDASAIALVRRAAQTVASLAAGDSSGPAEFEALARRLSALGFYIEALQHGPADIGHFLAIAGDGDAQAGPAAEPASQSDGSVDEQPSLRDTTPVAAANSGPSPDAPTPATASDALHDGFDLLAFVTPEPTHAERANSPQAADRPPSQAGTPDEARLQDAGDETAAPPAASIAPAALPPARSTSDIATGDTAADEELLAIFIEEAHEVLGTIAAELPRLLASRDDSSSLTAIRRGFHTLKGSGRMVGLTELGEAAWSVEQTLNRWLQLDWTPSPTLQALLETAHREFDAWVRQIEDGGDHGRDVAALVAAAEALRESDTADTGAAAGQRSPAKASVAPADTTATACAPDTQAEAPAESAPEEIRADDVEISGEALDTFLESLIGRRTVTEMLDELDVLPDEITLEDIELADDAPDDLASAPHDVSADLVAARADGRSREDHAAAEPWAVDESAADEAVAGDDATMPIRLGDRDISRALLELFLNEAREHIGDLREELGHLQRNPMFVPAQTAVRTAHTLAGISGTAGVLALQGLARALEHALERVGRAGVAPSADQGELLCHSIVTMDAMLGEVAHGKLPMAVPELEEQLAHIGQAGAAPPARPALSSPAAEAPAIATTSDAAAAVVQASAPVHDDIDRQLLPLFLDEGHELLRALHAALRDWRTDGDVLRHAHATARLLHTLKGSARMTGAMQLGELVHQLESRLESALHAGATSPSLLDELIAGLDDVERHIEALRRQQPEDGTPPAQAIAGHEQQADAVAASADPGGVATLRVRAETVDHFVNTAGEIGIARTRIEGELRTVRRSLLDLTENVIRLRNQLREVELQAELQMQSRIAQAESQHADFDPLEMDRYTRLQELTRMLAESVGDVTTVQQNLLRNLDGAELALAGQARLSRDLQQSLMQVRMVPFDSLADRLHRVVRQSAKELGKRVNLDLRGGRTEIDRSVLEHITAPLEHLLRNAVAHGIEPAEARRAAGKDAIGQITVSLAQEGNEIAISLADDGGGLDHQAIAARARSHGLLGDDETADERRLTQLIFVPGFSTATSLSTLSGRGVGMDVVKSETAAVGGRIDVHSERGRGTEFRIHLPLTLAVTQALLVQAGSRTHAVPSSMIAQVLELKGDALEAIRAAGGTDWQGAHYPYHYLPELLGEHAGRPELQRFNWLLLLRAGTQTLALHVDALKGNQEIVVKHAGPQLTRIIGISGATVLGDGQIVLILNPVALASRRPSGATTPEADQTALEYLFDASDRPPTVMVVDDSLTVRKITGRLLEREGYRVVTAKDGSDALEQLLEEVPDVILTDIEMPRLRSSVSRARRRHGSARVKYASYSRIAF